MSPQTGIVYNLAVGDITAPPPDYTHTINAVDYLPGGQTWTGVADIRSTLEGARDAAYAIANADANARVKINMPAGVGRLTSVCASGDRPVYRKSTATTKNVITNQAGIALHPNLLGNVYFVGQGRASTTIRLSTNAQSLFFIDTDHTAAGSTVSWVSTGRYYGTSGSRFLAERPASQIILRNFHFLDFLIDNNNTLGSTVLIGNRPSLGIDQVYVSVQNVHVTRVDCVNFVIPAVEADTDTNSKAFVNFRVTHNTKHEAVNNGGMSGGYADETTATLVDTPLGVDANSADHWEGWDLDTGAGRNAAYAAGFTWYVNCTVNDCVANGPTRSVIFVGHRDSAHSHYMDRLYVNDCVHDTMAGFRNGDPYFAHTSFYLGGDCIGGHGGVYNSESIAIGDDCIEAGGWTDFEVDGFYGENAVLDFILYVHSQKPLDAANTTLTIRNLHTKITGDALAAGTIRGIPFEQILEGEGDTPESSAAAWPIHTLTVEDSLMEVDGNHDVDGAVTTRGTHSNFTRVNRIGLASNYPARNVVLRRNTAKYAGMHITATSGTTDLALAYVVPRSTVSAGGLANLEVEDLTCIFSDVTTAGQKVNLVGLIPACSGLATVGGVHLVIENTNAVNSYDIIRVKNRLSTGLGMPASGGTVVIDGADVVQTSSTITGSRVGVDSADTDYTLASLSFTNVVAPTVSNP